MDELIDILDSEGNYTGETKMKSHAHRMGLFHATVHIWLYTKEGQVLIQQRGRNKDVYPLLWDVSVAGHVGAGEQIEISAVREIKEEIGLHVQTEQLIKIGVFKSIQKHHDNLLDCEFHYTFICELQVSLNQLKKQESEVENLDLIPLVQFEKEMLDSTFIRKYVPHANCYYQSILKAISEKL